MRRSLPSILIALAALLVVATAAGSASGDAPFPYDANTQTLSPVYFTPLDEHARALLAEVAPTMAPWLPGPMGYAATTTPNRVSTVYGTQPMRVVQPEREKARLRKMMLRYIGFYWCGLPTNNNPQSVLYKTIISTADLDRMAPTLPASCHK